jgi:hypothetical protein
MPVSEPTTTPTTTPATIGATAAGAIESAPALPLILALEPSEVARRRVAAVIIFLFSGGLLGVAWALAPAQKGFGTHQAL